MRTSPLEALLALNARYASCIDDDRLEDWPEFFTDDCVYRITTAENHEQGLPASVIYARSKGMLRDRVSALREASVYERQRYRHVVGVPLVDPPPAQDDAGVIDAVTPFIVLRIMRDGATAIFASGRYVDRIDPNGQVPRFVQRIVVCDSCSFDTLLALPL